VIGGREEVVVHMDAAELGGDQVVGTLGGNRSRSGRVYSFSYDASWLARPGRFSLDPSLGLYEGEQFAQALPGIFTDAAPDRWGRRLLERREDILAKREGRRPRTLDDWDFLTGVSDQLRMGALRLASPTTGRFLDDSLPEVPANARLRELEHLARLADEDRLPVSDESEWLRILLAPGSSLGGTRPKANFQETDGALWIAKFPSREDRRDVGAWEYVMTQLAERSGIGVPRTQLLRLASTYRTFCSQRFDRVARRRRLYASALTMTGKRDGDEASYLDLAEAITFYADPQAIDSDLEQLFRRLVFNILAANRDDHLRNHGFLRGPKGWRLSPVFDLNPAPETNEHSLALDEASHIPDLRPAFDTAGLYRLSDRRARAIVDEIRAAVGSWREVALAADLPREDVEPLAAAFEMAPA
jgi:serine/threonine-protein kinase HipA